MPILRKFVPAQVAIPRRPGPCGVPHRSYARAAAQACPVGQRAVAARAQCKQRLLSHTRVPPSGPSCSNGVATSANSGSPAVRSGPQLPITPWSEGSAEAMGRRTSVPPALPAITRHPSKGGSTGGIGDQKSSGARPRTGGWGSSRWRGIRWGVGAQMALAGPAVPGLSDAQDTRLHGPLAQRHLDVGA